MLFFSVFLSAEEEIVVTGSYIKNTDNELSPIETFSRDDYLKFNTMSLSEISRYVPSISGSHFQTNSMDGEDQGMSENLSNESLNIFSGETDSCFALSS